MDIQARPFVKCAGGKTQLLPQILPRLRRELQLGTYREPFLGGGAVFFALQPKRAVLSDANLHLVTAYQIVRDRVEDLVDLLHTYPNDEKFYYDMRGRDLDPVTESVHAAARFIYLNKTCFNGLYRVNLAGKFNVPFGRYDNPLICDAENLRACSRVLQDTEIMCRDFEENMREACAGDLVYCDPPYVPVNDKATSPTTSFTAYNSGGFRDDAQVRLRDAAAAAAARGARVLLSNSSAPRVAELYSKWKVEPVDAKRSISSKVSTRGNVKEFLIESKKLRRSA